MLKFPESKLGLSLFRLTSSSVDSGWAEGLPHDGLTDVGGDEEGDSWAQTISLL